MASAEPEFELHHFAGSRSGRPVFALEILGAKEGTDYTLTQLEGPIPPFNPKLKQPEFLQRNPAGTVPTAIFKDGTVLTESGAITQYIVEQFDKDSRLQPPMSSSKRRAYLQWFWWSECSLTTNLVQLATHTMLAPEERRVAWVAERARDACLRDLTSLENHLNECEWVAGSFSAADIMLSFPLYLAGPAAFKMLSPETFPRTAAYLQRMAAMPGFKKAFGDKPPSLP